MNEQIQNAIDRARLALKAGPDPSSEFYGVMSIYIQPGVLATLCNALEQAQFAAEWWAADCAIGVEKLRDALGAGARLARELRKEIKAQMISSCHADDKLQAALAENGALKDAMIGLREFRATPGAAEAAFDGDGAKVLLAGLVHVMRSAPNYLETTFDLGGNADRFVLTIRRAGGRSPHEMRVEAERQVEALRAEVERLKARADDLEAVRIEQAAKLRRHLDELQAAAAHTKDLEAENERLEARIDAAGEVLSANGCDCECACGPSEHFEDCDPCLACRVSVALTGGKGKQ